MPITIQPSETARLHLSGDVETVRLSAQIEWISVAAGSEAFCPSAASDEADEAQLELAIGERIAA